MLKKHTFLRVVSKITIFACVFCAFPAWSDTTCNTNFTPIMGNSWQNGTPTPTNPVAIESIGTKVGNKYAVQVAVNYDGGVVDLGTLDWSYNDTLKLFIAQLSNWTNVNNSVVANIYCSKYSTVSYTAIYSSYVNSIASRATNTTEGIAIRDSQYTDAAAFKKAMSGVMLYYQRETDETWTAPTLKTVYLDEPLRKVGEYADVLDYKKGQIIRNVGVKVFDGTESWALYAGSGEHAGLVYSDSIIRDNKLNISTLDTLSTHFKAVTTTVLPVGTMRFQITNSDSGIVLSHRLYIRRDASDTVDSFKAYLAQQYAAGTPVTVYYPLATPVVEQIENWSCTPPITDIKIATTKMVDEEFKAAEAKLATTVQTIESVVSRTIAQTGQIQVLQDTKQTRPDESCPANMKCLLVQDEDGTPHWYPIIEP